MNHKAVILVAVSLAFVACKKADNQEASATATAVPATAAPTAPPIPTPDPAAIMAAAATAAAPSGGNELATMEDFEQQALDEINPQNLEKELDTLEQQIGQ
jgi:hypothetical protein